MALTMHTNYASLVTQNTLNGTSNLLNQAMERLSTGYRINSAADDAAGLQISNRLEAQSRGMSVAMRNAQDGISMMQTAEGAMDEMTNIAYRMNDLAIQAANGSASADDKTAMQAEFAQLGEELDNIMTHTAFGGQTLLSGGGFTAAVNFQIGATSGETLEVDVTEELTNLSAALTAAQGADLSDDAATESAIDIISGAGAAGGEGSLIDLLGAARSALGANINRLDHTIANLGNMVENTSAAKGRITDTDFAVESSNMTKNQMLMQAGTTVLSQTNQLPGLAMSLLR